MRILNPAVCVFVTALLFTYFFHGESIGLNLFLYELAVVLLVLFTAKEKLRGTPAAWFTAGLLLSAGAVAAHASAMAIVVNIPFFILWTGALLYPSARQILVNAGLALLNFGLAFRRLSEKKFKRFSTHRLLRGMAALLVSLLIVAVFVLFYRQGNPYFSKKLLALGRQLSLWLQPVSWSLVFTFLLGLLAAILVFARRSSPALEALDRNGKEELVRRRSRIRAFTAGLRRESRNGVLLLVLLNFLLLYVNYLDITNVWFGFDWKNGGFLKQFVHEGTWMLIISILCSMLLVLYFFRGNLNFFTRSRTLRLLSYAWLAQNALLAVSVIIRNLYYVEHFALAYRRIGVFIFLLAVFYGLLTIYIKVSRKKTGFYLLKVNSRAVVVLLVCASLVNWDRLIAKYNFSHYETAFVELDFAALLDDNALPLLDIPRDQLPALDRMRRGSYRETDVYYNHPRPDDVYLDAWQFHKLVERRKAIFAQRWKKKSWLSWNWAGQQAYNALLQEPEFAERTGK